MKQTRLQKTIAFRFKRFSNKSYSAFNSMHKIISIGVVVGSILTFAHTAPLCAQSAIATEKKKIAEQELDEVIVTASRVDLPVNQTSRLVTVITKVEIERAPVQSIQDLLNYTANIDVIQRGGHGVQADISIRGGSFDQTAILLNGANLSNPQTGHYSFDIPINLSDIEQIEIIHGPSSIIYGASAFSGGINIITKKNPDFKVFSKAEFGMHQMINLQSHGVFKTRNTVNQLSLGHMSSNGYINNSDYKISNLLWQSRLLIDNSNIDIQLGYNNKQYGANTFYSAAFPNQFDKTSSLFAIVKTEYGKKLKIKPQIYWNRHYDCFQLDKYTIENKKNYHRTDVFGANLNFEYKSSFGITSAGTEFRNEGIVSNILGRQMNTAEGKYTKSDNRTNISYALEHNFLINKITLSGSVLINYNTAFRNNEKFFPSLSASYQITDNLKTYISWSKATRMPTFTDLYYTSPTHLGNTDLKAEQSEALELGFKYKNHFLTTYFTAYLMNGNNMIDWVKKEANDKWESRNLTEIDKKGIELGMKLDLHKITPSIAPDTYINVGYARLHQGKKTGEWISNYVLNYLRDKFTVQLNHQVYKNLYANWNFRWQNRIGTFIKYTDLKPGKVTSYSPFSIVDLSLNWKINNFIINFNSNNIFDTHYYDLGNIPQAGIWLSSGVSYTFK